MFLSALQSLIPPLFAVVLQNAPFTGRVKLHGDMPAIEGGRRERDGLRVAALANFP